MAQSLGIPTRELNQWIAGKPGTIDLLSAFTASSGINSLDELLGGDEHYLPESKRLSSMQEMLLIRLGQISTLEEVRLIMQTKMMIAKLPEIAAIIQRGFDDALDYADHQGFDVATERRLVERGLSPFFQEEEKNKKTG